MTAVYRKNTSMFRRHLETVLTRTAGLYPVITITGPRQSGKTTLVRHAFADHRYISLEQPDVRERALRDPRGFMDDLEDVPVILDEVQRAPDLLSYIQVAVDREDRPGRFVLTGSQNIFLLRGISQTLAGRTAVLRLLPLSLSELLGREPLDVAAIEQVKTGPAPSPSLWQTVWTGFYPRIHDKGIPPQQWLADYYRTYIERDLRDVLRVMDLDAFERFVRLAAAHTGQELNLNTLASDAGVSQPTARQWMSALRIGYLTAVLHPHHRNFRKRLRKRPRLHFLDSGLVCYLLGIRDPQQLAQHPLRGAIFESFVVTEFLKAFTHAGQDPAMYFWRDVQGHEIDALLDLGDRFLPIEMKSGATVAPDAVDGLLWWCDLKDNPTSSGVLVHGGSESFSLKGMRVLPWYLA